MTSTNWRRRFLSSPRRKPGADARRARNASSPGSRTSSAFSSSMVAPRSMGKTETSSSGFTPFAWIAFTRNFNERTAGPVQVKWYFGSITGDEVTALDRIHRGQLDGAAGAGFCDRLAPSLRVTRVLGLFQSHEESSYVLGRLRATLRTTPRRSGRMLVGPSIPSLSVGTGCRGRVRVRAALPARDRERAVAGRLRDHRLDARRSRGRAGRGHAHRGQVDPTGSYFGIPLARNSISRSTPSVSAVAVTRNFL